MANELNIAAKTGLTVTAQRYQSGAAVGSAISLSEVGSSGFYSGNMTGTAGTYQLAFISAGANIGIGQINWSGTAEIPVSTFNASSDTVARVTLVDTATTLTNSPSVPSAASIASATRTELATELGRIDASVSSRLAGSAYTAPTSAPTAAAVASAVRTELTEISNLDASVSSRLASASYTAPANSDISAIKSKTDNLPAAPAAVSDIPTTAQIATAVEGSILNENDGQAVLNAIVGAIGNTNVSEVSLVAAIRSDLERNGGKLDSIPTSSAPSANSVASAVWAANARTITGGTVDTLTNAPNVPSAVQIRQEMDSNSSKLANLDATISSRLADADYVAPTSAPSASTVASAVRTELGTELAKVAALDTQRLGNVSTVATTGAQLAAALS